jgi:hypothetical protein
MKAQGAEFDIPTAIANRLDEAIFGELRKARSLEVNGNNQQRQHQQDQQSAGQPEQSPYDPTESAGHIRAMRWPKCWW